MNQAKLFKPSIHVGQPVISALQTKPGHPHMPAHSVTELVMTQNSGDEITLLLPMLAHLCRVADRWITWVNPDKVDRELLESFGVDMDKIRLIHCANEDNEHRVLKEALQQGNSHTVIASPSTLNEKHLVELQGSAKKGASHGLFIRYRQSFSA